MGHAPRQLAADDLRRGPQAIRDGYLRARRSSPPRCSWPSAYFFHITTFYYILKWVPKIVVEHGLRSVLRGRCARVGERRRCHAAAPCSACSRMRFGVKGLTIGAMVLSTVMVVIFGRTPPDLQKLSLHVRVLRFFTNGAIVGMYAIFAQAFPTHVRAGGTGFGIGVGRGGSVLAPIIAGLSVQRRHSRCRPCRAVSWRCGSLCRRRSSCSFMRS